MIVGQVKTKQVATVLVASAMVVTGLSMAGGAPTFASHATTPDTTLTEATPFQRELVRQVDVRDANRHLVALQRIAELNQGNRAAGTPGHEASLAYIQGALKSAGFEVSTQDFTFGKDEPVEKKITVDNVSYDAYKFKEGINTPTGGHTAPLEVIPPSANAGCEAADFATHQRPGAVFLIMRGTCAFHVKVTNAMAAGASAVVIYNNVDGPLVDVSLTKPFPIPVGALSKADGEKLSAKNGAALTMNLVTITKQVPSKNLIAQTKTGRKDNVVMLGSHLDGVPAGPGINDNGSGSSGLLDLALKMGSKPTVRNAVRFAWWSAEELGLQGSAAYVQSLNTNQRLDVAMYLNFDMIGSPNAGFFVFDGDNSDNVGAPAGPMGSDNIEQTLVNYLQVEAKTPVEGTDFNGRSDYGPFIKVGIPAGGTFTGAEGKKTAAQVAKWGGSADVAYDQCYHQACDTLRNVNRAAMDKNMDAMAWAVGLYAYTTEGVNGMPDRSGRARNAEQAAILRAAAPEQTHIPGCGHEVVES